MKIGEKKKTLFLPHDLLIQILLRLPGKSLQRFKCISKLWFSLISDPHFAKLHFELTAIHNEKLLLFAPHDSEIRYIDINAPSLLDSSASSIVVKLNFPLPQPYYNARIVGSCRGFVLFDCYPNLYLWNPTTGFHKQIPLSPIYFIPDPDEMSSFRIFHAHGFGYDPSTDDYLITVITDDPNIFSHFSLKANTWKVLEGPPLLYADPGDYGEAKLGLHFNEAIHWFACRDDQWMDVIVVFDLVDRSFFEIGLPHDFAGIIDDCRLRVFGGLLSLCCTGYGKIAIWVMEEYRVQSSWSKRDFVVSDGQLSWRFLDPIYCTRSGDTICCKGLDAYDGLVKFNENGEMQEYSDPPNTTPDWSKKSATIASALVYKRWCKLDMDQCQRFHQSALL